MTVERTLRLPVVESDPESDEPGRARPAPRIAALSDFDAIGEQWSELAAAGGDVFATWEWATTWWRHFGAGRQLDLTGCYDEDDRLVGILPFYRTSARPLRVTRLVGYPVGSRSHPVCAPEDRATTARGLVAALRGQHADLFIGEGFPADEGWSDYLAGTAVASVPSPTLSLKPYDSWGEYLASRSSNFRQDLKRKERKLARDHDVVFRQTVSLDELGHDIDTFLVLHFARWATRSNFLKDSSVAFHRSFAHVAFERGWLRLWFLELDGAPAAAWYGFRFAGIETYFQAGRAPADSGSSLGIVLLAHTIREALADGIGEYRFGPGGSPYKYRFTDTDPGLRTLILPLSARGRIAIRAQTISSMSPHLRHVAAKLGRRG